MIKTYTDETQEITAMPDEVDLHKARAVETSVQYRNYTNYPINICTRDGLTVALDPIPTLIPEEFRVEVSKVVRMHREVATTTLNYMQQMDCEREWNNIIADALQNALRTPTGSPTRNEFLGMVDVVITTKIPLKAVMDSEDRAIYVPKLDLLVHCGDVLYCPKHPYSDETILGELMKSDVENWRLSSFCLNMQVVNNQSTKREYFINLNGEVFPVRIHQIQDKEDGVYVYSDSRGLLRYPLVDCFKTDSPSGFRLYQSREDAEFYGDPEERARQRKEEFEFRKLDREEERQRRKDHYEERSQQRKDWTEFLKWAPTIITGFLALVTMVASSMHAKGAK